jgi:predicted ribonuclease YlaK
MIERYTLPEMAAIWTEQRKYEIWLEIETLACEAQAELGHIPKEDAQTIRAKAKFNLAEIMEIEKRTNHDVIAFLENVASYVGPACRWMHQGMTSSDVLDTTLAVQTAQASDILLKDLRELREVIAKRAKEFKTVPMIGRSHGIHAEPITFGLKLALMYDEFGRALGMEAQDYRTDRVEDVDIRLTMRRSEEEYETLDVAPYTVQAYASQETIVIPEAKDFHPNHYLLLRNEEEPTHAIPARHVGSGELHKLRRDRIAIRGGRTLAALNLGQRFLLDALYDPAITLVTVYGKAGTGKTLLTVGAALEQVQIGVFEKMLITRVIMPTGRDIGYLPGKLEEKMQPWVQPAFDALELLLTRPRRPEQFENKRQSQRKADDRQPQQQHNPSQQTGPTKPMRPWEPLTASGRLEIEAITHIRGRSIPNAVFIVDEAQQLTPHEAKTLITRMGKGSKMILIGDLGQIDNPYVDAHTNGLVYARNRLQGQPWMAHINLFKGERSEMAEVAANLM